MINIRKILQSPLLFIVFVFFSLALNIIFVGYINFCAILYLCIPLWGLAFIIVNHDQLNQFHYFIFVLFLLMGIVQAIHKDLTVLWPFTTRIWCIIVVTTVAGQTDREKIIAFMNKFTLMFLFLANLLTICSIFLVKMPQLLELFPNHFKNLIIISGQPSTRLFGIFLDPTITAAYCVLGIFASCFCLFYLNRWKILSIINVGLALIIIYLARGRGAMLATGTFFSMFFLLNMVLRFNSLTKRQKTILFCILICAIVCLLAVVLLFAFNTRIQDCFAAIFRFSLPEDRSLPLIVKNIFASLKYGSGRDILVHQNWEEFSKSPIIGTTAKSLHDNSLGLAAHNGFLLILFYLGIPIFVMYCGLLVLLLFPLVRIVKNRKNNSSQLNILVSFILAVTIAVFQYNMSDALLSHWNYDYFNSYCFVIFATAYNLGLTWQSRKNSDSFCMIDTQKSDCQIV